MLNWKKQSAGGGENWRLSRTAQHLGFGKGGKRWTSRRKTREAIREDVAIE